MNEPFRLLPPKRPKKKFENQPVARQALLLVDTNDLPGQQSLFQLNGQPDAAKLSWCRLCGEHYANITNSHRFFCPVCAETEERDLKENDQWIPQQT